MLRTSKEPADVWVLRLSAITMATRPRCLERATALRTCAAEHISSASGSNTATLPAITPIHQAKTRHFPIIPRRFDQALPASSFSRPHARQGRVKSYLHLILQREVSAWQESEHISQVGGKLLPQVSFDQVMNGERFGEGRPG